MKSPKFILPLIVLAQFTCTSLWFAGNAAMPQLIPVLGILESDLGFVTSSVQFGFIIGTLFYAIFTVADRFNPSNVFFISALLGALFNVLIIIDGISFSQLLAFRFLTGFFLAGIYPVGMKIASDYFEKGLGKAMSFLVGALVLGTAFPHLIASIETDFSWKFILVITSTLAVLGGLTIKMFVGIGPYRKQGQKLKFSSMKQVFSNREFRAASIGYFGHMWELYAFWAFVPIILGMYSDFHRQDFNASLLSFFIIGIGGLACVVGGMLSERIGVKKVATYSLMFSGFCCVLSIVMFQFSPVLFLIFLFFWGCVVIADSPLFSTLVAQTAPPELKGTALTLVTCIGFSMTIMSIQLLSYLTGVINPEYLFLVLSIGPAFGIWSLFRS